MLPSDYKWQVDVPNKHYILLTCNSIFCRHLGDNSRLVVVKNAGHAANIEKSKEVCKIMVDYFQETANSSASIRGKVGTGCYAFQ